MPAVPEQRTLDYAGPCSVEDQPDKELPILGRRDLWGLIEAADRQHALAAHRRPGDEAAVEDGEVLAFGGEVHVLIEPAGDEIRSRRREPSEGGQAIGLECVVGIEHRDEFPGRGADRFVACRRGAAMRAIEEDDSPA
jgi:hypothetical protein